MIHTAAGRYKKSTLIKHMKANFMILNKSQLGVLNNIPPQLFSAVSVGAGELIGIQTQNMSKSNRKKTIARLAQDL